VLDGDIEAARLRCDPRLGAQDRPLRDRARSHLLAGFGAEIAARWPNAMYDPVAPIRTRDWLRHAHSAVPARDPYLPSVERIVAAAGRTLAM
jgi:hypothetical protein